MDKIPIASATLSSPKRIYVEKVPRRCWMPPYAKSCTLWLLNPWSICKCSSNALRVALQMQYYPRPSHFWHFPSPCSLFCGKIVECGPVCRNINNSLRVAAKVDRPFSFDATPSLSLRTRTFLSYALTSHTSNMPSCNPSSTPSLASSPKRWSSNHTRLANSSKVITLFSSARISSNTQTNLQVIWPCWRCPTICHPLASWAWRSCYKHRRWWTTFLSCQYCKGTSAHPRVLYNSWCAQVGYCEPNVWPNSLTIGG